MSTPVNASTTQSERRLGSNRTRPTETKTRAMIATRKRMATYEIGGKSRRPTLIASQVELQTRQSASHAAGIRQFRRLFIEPFCGRICATVALGCFLVKYRQLCRRAPPFSARNTNRFAMARTFVNFVALL